MIFKISFLMNLFVILQRLNRLKICYLFSVKDERMIRQYQDDTEKMRSQIEELKTWYEINSIYL